MLRLPILSFLLISLLLSACQSDSAIARGGRLYDKWWVEAETNAPQENHPLWTQQTMNTREGADTWRCKECHGWDYRGADGVYGSGSHYTGFPGVLASDSPDPQSLRDALLGSTEAGHDFSAQLNRAQIDALVAFLATGLVDTRAMIAADGSVQGDATRGSRLYSNGCIGCHGQNGNEMNTEDPADEPANLGALSRENPWEVMHKTTYGQPGEPNMTYAIRLNWSQEDVVDLLAYMQTLPGE